MAAKNSSSYEPRSDLAGADEAPQFRHAAPQIGDVPTPEDILGEIGLVLVVVLGGVLATNLVLVALHMT
ncbi:MAG TPA: hypothetical protein VGF97_02010 [Rhizomicrobium sp.]|jgi:hypothetical protein